METTTAPADLAYDALGARSPDPSLLSPEELAVEVRRLRLRLDALRRQLAQRLGEMHEVRVEVGALRETTVEGLSAQEWRARALGAEAALPGPKAMSLPHGASAVYGRLRTGALAARRVRLPGRPRG